MPMQSQYVIQKCVTVFANRGTKCPVARYRGWGMTDKASRRVVSEEQHMNAEEEKTVRKSLVFQTFLKVSGLRINPESIESRIPPEPDILCLHESDGKLAFELVEICAEGVAQRISAARDGEEFGFVRSSDPSAGALRKKLGKNYLTAFPVDLLCYTAGRTISPDAVILAAVRPLMETSSGKFRRVWLLGDRCHLVWPLG